MYKKIPYGFVDIYGIEWSDGQVDCYNQISKEISDRLENGFPVSEQLLNDRHMMYMAPLYGKMRENAVSRRRSIRVIFQNGMEVYTDINGTVESIKKYYLQNDFNLGDASRDVMSRGKEVIFLQ